MCFIIYNKDLILVLPHRAVIRSQCTLENINVYIENTGFL